MKIFYRWTVIGIGIFALASCSGFRNEGRKDDGAKYAWSRIILDGEREFAFSKKKPGMLHTPQLVSTQADYGALATMEKCVQLYTEKRNLSGIRGAFLMAYVAASIPHRSGYVMSSYSEPLVRLWDSLGDEQFALCLSKMRPEVQSAVFYFLFFLNWPESDKEWDDRVTQSYFNSKSHTYALSKTVPKLKWPHDYEWNSSAEGQSKTK